MRRLRPLLSLYSVFFCLSLLSSANAQEPAAKPAAPPQTARQALIEMFLGKGAHAFEKHLPEAAKRVLIHQGDMPANSQVQRMMNFLREMRTQGEHVQTYDEGGILLSVAEGDEQKLEVIVEHDGLVGEEDEIELSLQFSNQGQLEQLPIVPRLIFSMKQEKEIWRLSDMTVALHVPLGDPEYLKGLRKQQNEASESAMESRMNTLIAGESSYAADHPDRGYTCNLSDLSESPAGDEAAPGAALGAQETTNPAASEVWNGYRVALAGCEGTPAWKYQITAVPVETDSGMKAFCSDESGTMRSARDGKARTCLSRGQPVNSGAGD